MTLFTFSMYYKQLVCIHCLVVAQTAVPLPSYETVFVKGLALPFAHRGLEMIQGALRLTSLLLLFQLLVTMHKRGLGYNRSLIEGKPESAQLPKDCKNCFQYKRNGSFSAEQELCLKYAILHLLNGPSSMKLNQSTTTLIPTKTTKN